MVEIARPRIAKLSFIVSGNLDGYVGIMIKEKPCELYAEAGSLSHLVIWLQMYLTLGCAQISLVLRCVLRCELTVVKDMSK